MFQSRPASASSRYLLVLAAAVLTLPAAGAEPPKPAQSDEPAALTEALESGDECSPASADGTASSCSLSALQLQRARLSRGAGVHGAGAGGAGGSGRSGAFESAPALQGSWLNEGRCSGGTRHELLFVMRHANEEELERMALERTSPSSPNFRRWLSRAEISRLARNEAGLQAVRAFLSRDGAASILQETAGGEIVRAEAPVGVWERLLDAEFSTHRHRDTGRVLVRAPSYSLPEDLHSHVAGVLKVVELGELIPSVRSAVVTSGFAESRNATNETLPTNCTPDSRSPICETFDELSALMPVVVTPEVLRRAYNVPPVAAENSTEASLRSKTSQMVYASLNQHWSPDDRAKFVSAFGIAPPEKVHQLDFGDAMSSNTFCKESPMDCTESNLDVQYMTAMSPWSRMGYYYMEDRTTFFEFLYRFIVDMTEMQQSPHVISISYGMPEEGATKTAQYAFDMMAKTLALHGVTLLAASGDDGAAGTLDRDSRFGPCWLTERLGLQVNWPASSPWVTAVGATLGVGSGHPEVVCSVNASGPAGEATGERPPLITSGGGFSKRLQRPAYQDGHHDDWSRGVPDVSLAGHAYAIVLGGKWLTVDGTSASTPSFGGMVSLLNAQRLQEGRPRVGFLNPVLYAHPEIFHDVTEGDNRCGSMGTPCCGGYDAGEGWDPATGLGSVDFAKLVAVLNAGGD